MELVIDCSPPLKRVDGSPISIHEISHYEFCMGDLATCEPVVLDACKHTIIFEGEWPVIRVRVVDKSGVKSAWTPPQPERVKMSVTYTVRAEYQ